MVGTARVAVELGPKGKKVAAVAPDWPGLERGGKNEDVALDRLLSYIPRYAPVAKLAGMEDAFASVTNFEVVERYPGTGSTDFWGISFAFSDIDQQEASSGELERELTLMRACWAFFDDVRARVSGELKKGPRGGGRDRDRIVEHTVFNEMGWAPRTGPKPDVSVLTEELIASHRDTYCDAIRRLHVRGEKSGKWPLRYLLRHTAYHTLDHAWEMEDRDLSVAQG